METFAMAGANASADAKSSTGSVVPSGSSTFRRRMRRVNTSLPSIRVMRVASRSRGPLARLWSSKDRSTRTRTRELKDAARNAVSFVSSPAAVPSNVFAGAGPQSPGFVSPAVTSSAGAPYSTESTVRSADRLSVAMAARSAEKSWRNVVLVPLGVGCACIHAPSPSWNATHAGWIQYATATLIGGSGGGGVDGNVPSEQALIAATRNRTQDPLDMSRSVKDGGEAVSRVLPAT